MPRVTYLMSGLMDRFSARLHAGRSLGAVEEEAYREHRHPEVLEHVQVMMMLMGSLLLVLSVSEAVWVQARPVVWAVRGLVFALTAAAVTQARARSTDWLERRLHALALLTAGLVSALTVGAEQYEVVPAAAVVICTYLLLPTAVGRAMTAAIPLSIVMVVDSMLASNPVIAPAVVVIWFALLNVACVVLVRHADGAQRLAWDRFIGERDARQRLEREVRERVRIETELRSARFDAESAGRARSAFLTTMSHEMRTPLNHIHGLAEVLLVQRRDEDEERSHLRSIRDAAQSLTTVIGGVLDLARIQSGRLTLQVRPFRLNDLVERVVSAVTTAATSRGLTVSCDVSDPGMRLSGDSERLHQVLFNLLANAVKFTRSGEVGLRITSQPSGLDALAITFEVHDTGIGISDEDLGAIFDQFTQVDPSLTRDVSGSGMGLAICRSLADLMGAELWAESQPGRGSSFFLEVTLPVVRGAMGAQPGQRMEAVPHLGEGLDVLVVDDEPINRRVVEGMLRHLGHRPVCVESGAAALVHLSTRSVDVVLMDLRMPGMDGVEATRRIRERGDEVPIFALTAHTMQSDRDACFGAGMDAFLTKPISMDVLDKELASVSIGVL